MDELLQRVRDQIDRMRLTRKQAAEQIGITSTALDRHLAGAYVRSDSQAKYRRWLDGRPPPGRPPAAQSSPPPIPHHAGQADLDFPSPAGKRDHPFTVVDLFSGCGGMSLGFDLAHDGPDPVFQTILALDVEERVVSLHNANHRAVSRLAGDPARWVDIADFVSATEMLAYYLDHLAVRNGDTALADQLDQLPPSGLAVCKDELRRLDARFLADLARIRAGTDFRRAYAAVDGVPGQTSVLGFHEAVGLPETSTARPRLGPLVWADHGDGPVRTAPIPDSADLPGLEEACAQARVGASHLWDTEIGKLQARTGGRGRGQLASSAGRIGRFLDFLDTPAMRAVKALWLDWRCRRDGLRRCVFTPPEVEATLRRLYTGPRRVDVLLGGPPCQGFSRIGRGKIRSLREDGVHVGTDPEAGDVRNLLLLKYVEFVSALEPAVFLFENVRHFQARVQTPEGTFLATEILNDAIADLSQQRLRYQVADRVVDCSRHGIPQTRERYVLAGVRSDRIVPGVDPERLPGWCLDLPVVAAVPLRVALSGLPAPLPAPGTGGDHGRVRLADAVVVEAGPAACYLRWVRQGPPGERRGPGAETDAHTVRPPRSDDEAFFRLLGPGQRWMDYRCDDSPTLTALRHLVDQLLDSATLVPGGPDRSTLEELRDRLDGSLSLRLLLEGIAPREGEPGHHLLTASYLAKREGNNGDWIARLHPDRPAKTVVSHMAKDTYAYVHPSEPRTLSVREAARIQTFPDWFAFGSLGLVDAFRAVGNAVPPLLSHQFAIRVARLLRAAEEVRPLPRVG